MAAKLKKDMVTPHPPKAPIRLRTPSPITSSRLDSLSHSMLNSYPTAM